MSTTVPEICFPAHPICIKTYIERVTLNRGSEGAKSFRRGSRVGTRQVRCVNCTGEIEAAILGVSERDVREGIDNIRICWEGDVRKHEAKGES
jgi:hypothetical protein